MSMRIYTLVWITALLLVAPHATAQSTDANPKASKDEAATARPANSPTGDTSSATVSDVDEEVEEVEEVAEAVEEPAGGPISLSVGRTAIMTVVSRDEIQLLGYRSIGEVLRNTVGFGINDNGHWPDTGVRGINGRTTYGDKIQFVLDGHDMSWRQFNRNFHNAAWVDMDEIDRIEIVRGPGSALWGANALNGVVNIITRNWSDMNSAEFTFGGNHLFSDQNIFARAGANLGPVSLYTSVSYHRADSDELLAPIREFTLMSDSTPIFVRGDHKDGITWNVKAKYKWLKLGFHKSRYDTQAPLSTFSIINGDDSRFVTNRHIVTAAVDKMLMPGLDLRVRAYFDHYDFDEGTAYEGNPGSVDSRFLRKMEATDYRYNLKAQVNYLPTLAIRLLLGAEVEYLDLVRWHFPEVWATDGLPRPDFTNWHTGVFLQGRYSPWRWLDFTAGVRFDYDEAYNEVLTPRAGVIVALPAGFSMKAQFGMAYKGPSFHDLYYFRKNAFYGNPNLETESAMTGEGQLIYQRSSRLIKVDARLTGFYTRIENLIGYAKRDAGTPLESELGFPTSQRPDTAYSQKTNLAYVTTTGFEAEAMVQIARLVTLRAQGTYRRPRDDKGERLQYSSEWTAGAALSVHMSKYFDATLRGLAVGNKLVANRAISLEGFPNFSADDDPTLEAPAYFVGSLVFRAKKLLNDRVSVFLKLDNFTNTDYWDAGRDILYPQRRFQAMMWVSTKASL